MQNLVKLAENTLPFVLSICPVQYVMEYAEKPALYITEKILTYAAKIFSGMPKRQIAHLSH